MPTIKDSDLTVTDLGYNHLYLLEWKRPNLAVRYEIRVCHLKKNFNNIFEETPGHLILEPKFTDKLGCIVKIDQSWYEDIRQRKIEFLVGAYEKGDKEHSGRWADKKLDVPWLLNGHFFQVTKSANRSFVFERCYKPSLADYSEIGSLSNFDSIIWGVKGDLSENFFLADGSPVLRMSSDGRVYIDEYQLMDVFRREFSLLSSQKQKECVVLPSSIAKVLSYSKKISLLLSELQETGSESSEKISEAENLITQIQSAYPELIKSDKTLFNMIAKWKMEEAFPPLRHRVEKNPDYSLQIAGNIVEIERSPERPSHGEPYVENDIRIEILKKIGILFQTHLDKFLESLNFYRVGRCHQLELHGCWDTVVRHDLFGNTALIARNADGLVDLAGIDSLSHYVIDYYGKSEELHVCDADVAKEIDEEYIVGLSNFYQLYRQYPYFVSEKNE